MIKTENVGPNIQQLFSQLCPIPIDSVRLTVRQRNEIKVAFIELQQMI